MNTFLISRFASVLAAASTGGIAAAVTSVVPADMPTGPGAMAVYIGSAVGGLVWVALKLRGILSRSSVNVTADNYLRESLEQSKTDAHAARTERDEAKKEVREAWKAANTNAVELGQLRAENTYMKQRLEEQAELLTEIRRGVQNVGKKVDTAKVKADETQVRISNSGIIPLGGNEL